MIVNKILGNVLHGFGNHAIKRGKLLIQLGKKLHTPKATIPQYNIMNEIKNKPLLLSAPTKAQVAARTPRFNIGKVSGGLNLEELNMSQVVKADGTHIRYYRKPDSNKLFLVTEDKGSMHKETIYGFKGENNVTTLNQVGDELTIIHQTPKGASKIYKEKMVFKDGINQKTAETTTYINSQSYDIKRIIRSKSGINGKKEYSEEIVIGNKPFVVGPYNSFLYRIRNCKLSRKGVTGTDNYQLIPEKLQNCLIESSYRDTNRWLTLNDVKGTFTRIDSYRLSCANNCNPIYKAVRNSEIEDLDLALLLKPFEPQLV